MESKHKTAIGSAFCTQLDAHQERCKALAAQRQALLQQQSGLLRGYIMAGVQLPGAGSDSAAASAVEKRQRLVEQLTQEEGAARAALEALKQGSSLAKAREVGQRMFRQTQDLAGSAAGDVEHSSILLAGQLAEAGNSSSNKHQLELAPPQTAAADRRGGGQIAAGRPTAPTLYVQPARRQAVFSNVPMMNNALGRSRPDLADGLQDYDFDRELLAEISEAHRQQSSAARMHLKPEESDSWTSAKQQQSSMQHRQQHSQPKMPAARPGSSIDSAMPPAHVQELKAQITALQSAVESQLRPAVAAANPWSQLFPAMTAAAMMASPMAAAAAVAAAAAAGQPQGVPAFGFPGMQPPAAPVVPGLSPDMLAADPVLAAAASAYTRDMALLRMDVERAKGAAELQHVRQQLASLQAAADAGVPQQLATSPSCVVNANSGRQVTGLQQQQQQQQQLQQPGQQHHSDDEDEPVSIQPRLSDNATWLTDLPAAGQGAQVPAVAATGGEEEVLGPEQQSALLAAKGSNADVDVLQVHIQTAGPFSKRGAYRVAVVLYEGYQPVESGVGQLVTASTSKRLVTPPGMTAASSTAAASGEGGDASSDLTAAVSQGVARFSESLSLKGVRLSSSSQVVFELYMAKPGLAGLPTKELLVGWAVAPLLQNGHVLPHPQSVPLFRLPLMLTAQCKFTYDNAMLDFKLTRYKGAPGDVEILQGSTAAAAASQVLGKGGRSVHEDIPGVPSEAWVRVQRGVPPADPYTPGDGLVVVVDGARFLPSSATISKVVGSVWSSSGALLAGPFEGVAQPDSDAFMPVYACTATVGASHNLTRFEDPTATLMLQIQTIERTSRSVRVVGFALLNLFLDPKAGGQPVSRNIQDYVLNQGAFQIPLHAGAPSTSGPLRMTSLDSTPRLPCASMLIRILTPEAAKLQRRKPLPSYLDRVYDTSSRCMPTSLERKLYAKVVVRKPFAVREAARLVAWYRRVGGGLGGKRISSGGRRAAKGAVAAWGTPAAAYAVGGAAPPAAGGGPGGGNLLSRMFGGAGDDDGAAAADLNTGDPFAAIEERQQDVEESKAELLPPSDPETMDWMSDIMEHTAAAAAGSNSKQGNGSGGELSFINFNTGFEYTEDLGFFVALDGAARLSRLLPTAGLVSYSPPGSLYQDHPLVDDVKVTLDYDLEAPLAAPRWLDGYQQFADVPYHPGLVVLIDVRCVVPGSGSSAPAGWACLPVFERAGRYVASGTYQLPLFQGVPSHQLLAELALRGDPDTVMAAGINSGRVRPSVEAASVLVRLMCGSRQGQLEAPAWSLPLQELRLPRYVVNELGPRFVSEMRKMIRNKTYSMAKPKALTDEQWVDQINDTLIKVAGLDEHMEGEGDSGDELESPVGGIRP